MASMFLRNLDEANLQRLAPQACEDTVAALGPDPDMRIFGRGLRHRLAPMLGGNGPRLRMAFSLLFALPGAPQICYGDGIGMGDDPAQDGRNDGFLSAPKPRLTQPVLSGDFGPDMVNAEDQWADEGSLLKLATRLAAIRPQHRRVGQGEAQPIANTPDSVIGLRHSASDHDLVVLHNLSAKPARLALDLGAFCQGQATALLGEPLTGEGGKVRASLPGYGFLWSKWAR